jgi:hypothetical protein
MYVSSRQRRLELPESLRTQMFAFRRRVWIVKLVEAGCGAAFGVLVAYLATFLLDRVWDTPADVRAGIFALALVSCTLIPLALHRWIWRQRQLEQLARLLSRTHPSIGDQLLGIIELVHSESEQARSMVLCEAAVHHVADQARSRDFTEAVPNPKHRRRGLLAFGALAIGIGLLAIYPAAATNAWARFLAPWRDTPRYTFAMVEGLPDRLVVAHGEPFTLPVKLAEQTVSRPNQAEARIGEQQPVVASLADGRYPFELPPQIEAGPLDIRVGDYTKRVRLEPTLRPELSGVEADVVLPDYLGRKGSAKKDVRGGTLTVVNGSKATFIATATRDLASATVDGNAIEAKGPTIVSPTTVVNGSRPLELRWHDQFGLGGKEPFVLTINGKADEPPTISCDGLPSRKVVLDSEHLSFKATARDDYGVKRVGVEWRGIDNVNFKKPAVGERILAAGAPEQELLELAGTFTATELGIEPQPINVRLFAEDYYPGRERVYSATYVLYVLNAEQHAIWLTEQLSKWHRLALNVRDKELQLYETNKQLRQLSADELNQPDTRRRIEMQAEGERANGRRLSNLVGGGEDLVKQAMRNPEIGVGHLETWAEMLQILKDISANRMPSVADLLKQAAQSPGIAKAAPKSGPAAGQVRASAPGKQGTGGKDPPPNVKPNPSIVDIESSQQPPKSDDKDTKAKNSSSKPPRMGLPVTMLADNKRNNSESPAAPKMDEAVAKQQDLLAEFEKIADELNRVLANLEGSRLVKRLKAQSRLQTRVASRLGDHVNDVFGIAGPAPKQAERILFGQLSKEEAKSSQDVSHIMDDMQAYFERRRFVKFKTALDDMLKQDAIGGLRQLGDDLPKEQGLSISQCEFWSDTLDRWAEDLVDPACCGACPGCKSRDSLPPSIVLEVLQVLEAEINLREDTRVAQQARAALAVEQFTLQAKGLSKTQDKLRDRIEKVTERIRDLPEGDARFAPEIRLMGAVSRVMADATGILARPETGSPAIAAETEVIELILQSKRFNPGGGGGGSSPGGGGGGTTTDSALSLIGRGINEKEVREAPRAAQATGESGTTLPEEFRSGLDAYFNRLEKTSKDR